jgi:hypothetical protein
LNCRCDPRWRTCVQPSASICRMTSRTFTKATLRSPASRCDGFLRRIGPWQDEQDHGDASHLEPTVA